MLGLAGQAAISVKAYQVEVVGAWPKGMTKREIPFRALPDARSQGAFDGVEVHPAKHSVYTAAAPTLPVKPGEQTKAHGTRSPGGNQ
jgi:hypothetical protein